MTELLDKLKKVQPAIEGYDATDEDAEVEKIYSKIPTEQLKHFNTILVRGVSYISGTMPPAAASVSKNDIESLSKALTYFASENKDDSSSVKHVFLEPKYMGSRGTLYINKDGLRMLTSRSGIPLNLDRIPNKDELVKPYMSLLNRYSASEIVIDAELMPWSFLGQSLIDKIFKPISYCLNAEHEVLKDTGFHDSLLDAKNTFSSFLNEFSSLTPAEAKKKSKALFGGQAETVLALAGLRDVTPLDQDQEMLKAYNESLAQYAEVAEAPFVKAFSILKVVKNNGKNYFPLEKESTEQIFTLLKRLELENGIRSYGELDFGLKLDLSDFDAALSKAELYFSKIKEAKLEGIVIKPDYYADSIVKVPYMKVRCPDYLRIIYGYDYVSENRLKDLIAKKDVFKKRRIALVEWKLGEELLRASTKLERAKIIAKFLANLDSEQYLDSRL